MTIEPTTDEPLDRLLPGHRIRHDDRTLVVDEVTRKTDGWKVTGYPAHRTTGRRVTIDLDDPKATVTRLATPEEVDGVRTRIYAAVRAVPREEDAGLYPVEVAPVGEALIVRHAGSEWTVPL